MLKKLFKDWNLFTDKRLKHFPYYLCALGEPSYWNSGFSKSLFKATNRNFKTLKNTDHLENFPTHPILFPTCYKTNAKGPGLCSHPWFTSSFLWIFNLRIHGNYPLICICGPYHLSWYSPLQLLNIQVPNRKVIKTFPEL